MRRSREVRIEISLPQRDLRANVNGGAACVSNLQPVARHLRKFGVDRVGYLSEVADKVGGKLRLVRVRHDDQHVVLDELGERS
jgi:hypothetical protein